MYKTKNDYKYAQRGQLNREILEYFPKDVFRLRYENMLSNCESFKTQLTKIPKALLLSQKESKGSQHIHGRIIQLDWYHKYSFDHFKFVFGVAGWLSDRWGII